MLSNKKLSTIPIGIRDSFPKRILKHPIKIQINKLYGREIKSVL